MKLSFIAYSVRLGIQQMLARAEAERVQRLTQLMEQE